MTLEPSRRPARSNRRTFLGALGAGAAVLGTSTSVRGSSADAGTRQTTGIPAELASAIEIDAEGGTVTLPLFRGRGPDDEDVYYVLTESSRLQPAIRMGLNWSPKLENALGTPAVQEVTTAGQGRFNPRNAQVRFAGTVDFAPERNVAPGPDGFPLDSENTRPGSVGDGSYSPFVTPTGGDGVVFNAPHVQNRTGVHDAVSDIDTDGMTVTLGLVDGFYEGREELYISTDAYPVDVAALEGTTHAPTLEAAPVAGNRDLESSAREAIIPIVNGPMGQDNPERQGLRSAVAGEGGPLNVTRSEQVCQRPGDPTECSVFYSPLWDVHPVVWTEEAIDDGRRRRLTDHEEIIDLVLSGDLASAADGPVNTLLGNIHAAVAAVNCPIISIEEDE
ncbi:DUF7482 domain-containing protein [Halorarum salinum]|uniref:Twin-arginine translocation signal domain-containing protein n=1 Tax=Halorarum salinum TaxID=2743089 RepID=A0A7D5QBI4_9EURY|nr:twin-arginine translocation signal domain-containing protein [Halobaculum salinum]QLG61820.1 twin-arginine translocation signal domain-containing protein [Halobaculum salinum]